MAANVRRLHVFCLLFIAKVLNKEGKREDIGGGLEEMLGNNKITIAIPNQNARDAITLAEQIVRDTLLGRTYDDENNGWGNRGAIKEILSLSIVDCKYAGYVFVENNGNRTQGNN